jgi:hypothetical protein
MDGTIEVASTRGAGSVISVRLPAGQTDTAAGGESPAPADRRLLAA